MCKSLTEAYKEKIRILEKQNAALLAQLNLPPPPVVTGKVTGLEIVEVFLTLGVESGKIYLSDSEKDLTVMSELEGFLRRNKLNEVPYVAEKYDCDDFTNRLLGDISIPGWASIPFGKAWGVLAKGLHAYNVFIVKVNNDLVAYYVEPQTDAITPLLEGQVDWVEI